MTLPSQPLPTVGQPNATEDAKTLAALAELQTILNGGVGTDNAGNRFLQLASIASRKIAFGTGSVSFSSLGYNNSSAIPHGLATTPSYALASIDRRANHGNNSDATFGPASWDGTNITWRGHLNQTAYAFNITVNFFWVAIG